MRSLGFERRRSNNRVKKSINTRGEIPPLKKQREMGKTKIFAAILITRTSIETLRVSNSKKQLNEFVRDYIHGYVKDLYGWGAVYILNGENCYTIMRNNNDFVAAFKIRNIACIVASPKELEEEKRETEKTAKNAE